MENPSRLEWFYTLPDFSARAGQSSAIETICWRVSRKAKENVLRRYHELDNNNEAPLVLALYKDLEAADRGEVICENWTAFLSRHAEKASKSLARRLIANKIDIPLLSGSGMVVKELMLVCFRFISEPRHFFANFNCDEMSNSEGWFAILYGYCRRKVEGQLIDEIRTWEGSKTFMRSGLGLISRSTEKRIADAASFYGVRAPQIEEYLLIWRCFKEAKDARLINTKSPKEAEYQIVADLTNRRRASSKQLFQELIDADRVKACLAELGEATRYYLDRSRISIDAPLASEGSSSLGDLLTDDETADPSEEIQWEDTPRSLDKLTQHIHKCLDDIRKAPKGITKRDWMILFLLKAVELTQSDIAKLAGCTQKTISKRNKVIWEKLVSEVVGMSWLPGQAPLDISSEAIEANLREALSGIIRNYFMTLLGTEIFPPVTYHTGLAKNQLLALLQDCFNLDSLSPEAEIDRKLEGFIQSSAPNNIGTSQSRE